MIIFFQVFLWCLFFLALLGLSGGFAVVPFMNVVTYPALIAPFFGLFFVVLGTSFFYTVLGFSLLTALKLTLFGCVSFTVFMMIFLKINKVALIQKKTSMWENIFFFVFCFVFVGFVTYLNCFSSIDFGKTAFLFTDGSDHLGYAPVADWLNTHSISTLPTDVKHSVYESWPDLMFKYDPRFGSFFTLAIISTIFHESGMFSYEMACSVVLCSAYLGIAAVFTRTRMMFFLLAIGLLTNYWFDYAGSGYFGKILGYSATLFILGLFLTTPRPFSLSQIAILLGCVLVASVMHSALSFGCFIFIVGGLYLLFQLQDKKNNCENDVLLWLLFLGLSVAATGVFARASNVLHINQSDYFPWTTLIPPLFDLERHGMNFSHLSMSELMGLTIVFNIISLFFLIVAIKQKNHVSKALLVAPYVLLIWIMSTQKYWVGQQLIGVFYSWFLCAAVFLIKSNESNRRMFASLLILLILAIGLHVPRFIGAIHRYAGNDRIMSLTFFKKELHGLAKATKGKIVTVNLNDSMFAIPLIVEISGKPNQLLQWTEQAWKVAVGYRNWEAPLLQPTPYQIVIKTAEIPENCVIQYTTQQYYLLKCVVSR